MPFDLKNARVTYHMLVNKMFVDLIGNTTKVYVDDMQVKRLKTVDRVKYLDVAFQILRRYRMRLNPLKYACSIAFWKFLDYMVYQKVREASLEKIKALMIMRSPSKLKEVKSLIGRLIALS